jgi:hypothetical protein
MKSKSFILLGIILVFVTSFSAYSQKADFSGVWKLNKEKTVLADNQLFLSGITIQVKNDSLLTSRVYENSAGEEYPFDENLSFDGKECKFTIYDMPRTSKASKVIADGSIIIESMTIFTGQNGEDTLAAKETWKVDGAGKILTMDFKNKMSGNEFTGTNIYDKVIK